MLFTNVNIGRFSMHGVIYVIEGIVFFTFYFECMTLPVKIILNFLNLDLDTIRL